MRSDRWLSMVALALPVAACGSSEGTTVSATAAPARIELRSSAFASNGEMPVEHGCEGEDRSPPLAWSGVPPGTKSLALVVDDPDAPDPAAPKMTFVHWVVYDIPPDASGLPSLAGEGGLPAGARAGTSDWPATAWKGPCPLIGRHRYFHKLYALDTVLGDLGTPTKAALEKAMAGHVIGQGELVGTYQKQKR